MHSFDDLKRKLEKKIAGNEIKSPDDVNAAIIKILGEKKYSAYKTHVDDIIAFYRTMVLERKVEKLFYHVIDLGNGEVTKGMFDIRNILHEYKFPESLRGKRVLDVGCADGFFSFHFERLGAKEVVAIDTFENENFLYARKKLASKVKYKLIDVMDINPIDMGYFDFVFCGTVLIHLSDPIYALKNIRNMIQQGSFYCSSNIHFHGTSLPRKALSKLLKKSPNYALLETGGLGEGEVPSYWIPTADTLRLMLLKGGFKNHRRGR